VDIADVHFVCVEFSLDAVTKGLVQTPLNITASVLTDNGSGVAMPTAQEAEQAMAKSECMATHHLDFGLKVKDMIVQVVEIKADFEFTLGGGTVHAVLSDAHGSIEALLSPKTQAEASRGSIIAVDGRMVSLQGRMVLLVEEARPQTKLRHGYSSIRMGQRNVSERIHLYGCLVIRGSKCLLAHGDNYAFIPFSEPRAHETRQQAATRAITETCKIYSEEVSLMNDLPPAVSYQQGVDGKPVVLTIYIAVATSEAVADGGGCGCGEAPESEDRLYDWYDFDDAIASVNSTERNSVLSLVSALGSAVEAGVVILSSPSAFGPKVAAINGDLHLNQVLALTQMEYKSLADRHNSQMKQTSSPEQTNVHAHQEKFECPPCNQKLKKAPKWTPVSDACANGKCPPGCC
jgi:hypothetical protein